MQARAHSHFGRMFFENLLLRFGAPDCTHLLLLLPRVCVYVIESCKRGNMRFIIVRAHIHVCRDAQKLRKSIYMYTYSSYLVQRPNVVVRETRKIAMHPHRAEAKHLTGFSFNRMPDAAGFRKTAKTKCTQRMELLRTMPIYWSL